MTAKSARLRSRASRSTACGFIVYGANGRPIEARFEPSAWGAPASPSTAELLDAAGAFARSVTGKDAPGHLVFATYLAATRAQVRADVEARLDVLRAEP